jgi:hypothetical protein
MTRDTKVRPLQAVAMSVAMTWLPWAHAETLEQAPAQAVKADLRMALNDVLAMQVTLANTTQDRIRVDNALGMACAAYNRRLGRALDAFVTLDKVTAVDSCESLEGATERALVNRVELQALDLVTLAGLLPAH